MARRGAQQWQQIVEAGVARADKSPRQTKYDECNRRISRDPVQCFINIRAQPRDDDAGCERSVKDAKRYIPDIDRRLRIFIRRR